MKVEVSIDPSCKEPKIIILTDKMTDEITELIKRLSESTMDSLAVFSHRGVVIISCKDIIRIYTEKQKVYVQTKDGIYTVRLRLYELEEKLDRKWFVRISNSEIVNIRMITNMDISMTGTIGVALKGDIKTYASRRYVKKIKNLFGI
ncbi:LytTR family DNA-binding domain-containing protein [Desmospora activa]|nr:LytTR family DNA-binding domain-containing protein [Desmospora activa]